MNKLPGQAACFAAALLGASVAGVSDAWAGFGGCVDSPENPTVVLGLLGGAVAAYPWLRAEISARRHKAFRRGETGRRDAGSA